MFVVYTSIKVLPAFISNGLGGLWLNYIALLCKSKFIDVSHVIYSEAVVYSKEGNGFSIAHLFSALYRFFSPSGSVKQSKGERFILIDELGEMFQVAKKPLIHSL